MENFTREEFELLKQIIIVSRNIKELYDDLADLEIHNQKNTDNYKELYKTLKYHIERENELYNKLKKNPDALYKFQNFLNFSINGSPNDNLNMFKMLSKSDLMKIRIVNNVDDLILKYELYEDEEFDVNDDYYEDDKSDNHEENDDDYEEEKEIIRNVKRDLALEVSLENDISSTIFAILDKLIHDEKYQTILNSLIEFKYNYSYISETLEHSMLSNNFEISKELYLSTYFTAMLQSRNSTDTQYFINSYVNKIVETQLKNIHYLFEDTDDLTRQPDIVLSLVILRAVRIFADIENLEKINENIKLSFLTECEDSLLLKQILDVVNSTYYQDREIPKVVILKRKL